MWANFEIAFYKQFLPSSKKKNKWKFQDLYKQKHCFLAQYISLYRDIVIKLDGLDDFKKVVGF